MTENPEDWKSTVDPSTGRVYWYHRRTRVSTWVKPNFKESGEEEYSHPTAAAAATASASSAISTNSTIYGTSNKSIVNGNEDGHRYDYVTSASASAAAAAQPSSTSSNNKPQPVDRYDIGSTLSSDLTFNEVQADTPLRFQSSHNIVNDEYQLDQLYDTILITSPDELSDNQTLLADLIDFVIAGVEKRLKGCRIRALKCLWRLSFSRIVGTTAFHLNQAWTNIYKFASKWEDHESIFLLVALLCNLSIGSTFSFLTADCIDQLSKRMGDIVELFLSEGKGWKLFQFEILDVLLDLISMEWNIALVQRGHQLAASFVLALASAALR